LLLLLFVCLIENNKMSKEKDFFLLSPMKCEEFPLTHLWKTRSTDSSIIFSSSVDPQNEDVIKAKLKEKGVKNPFICYYDSKDGVSVIMWIDLADISNCNIDHPSDENEEDDDSGDPLLHKKELVQWKLHAITHSSLAFETFSNKLRSEGISKIDDEKLDELLDEIDDMRIEEKRKNLIPAIADAKSEDELKKMDADLDKCVSVIRRCIIALFSPPPYQPPHPQPCQRLIALEKQVEELRVYINPYTRPAMPHPTPCPSLSRLDKLEEEVKSLKNLVEQLMKKPSPAPEPLPPQPCTCAEEVKELRALVESLKYKLESMSQERKNITILPRVPAVINKTLTFRRVDGCDDVYVARLEKDYPFALFYLEKEFLKKSGMLLGKTGKPRDSITCLIEKMQPHCSNQIEKQLTEEYHVPLGMDFYLCTGTLSE